MPYKDKEKQREFNRIWKNKRRQNFFSDKYCKFCKKENELELHHIDPEQKISHNIWSWREDRRLEEIAKCIILCHDCHLEETKKQMMIVGPDGKSWCGDCKDFVDTNLFGPGKRFNGLRGICNPCRKKRGWESRPIKEIRQASVA